MINKATQLFAEMKALFDEDDGALWGINLNAPFMIADAVTGNTVANMPDSHGNFVRDGDVYVGVIPSEIVFNTTVRLFDQVWGMVTWQFIEANANYPELVMRTMIHELFHAWQPTLFAGTLGSQDTRACSH